MHPQVIGIVNITEDSFSDGGKFLASDAAIVHAEKLLNDGADIVDLGPAASNPDALGVSAEEEMDRIDPVLTALTARNASISIDSFLQATQRFAIGRGAAFLNDTQGFPDPAFYPELASASCKLIVMHAVHGRGRAKRLDAPADGVWDAILSFFDKRICALLSAGVAADRIIVDPGMGWFLSDRPAASLSVLGSLYRLKSAFDLPVLVSVSRKSFLRRIVQKEVSEMGPASLAAELCAATAGADYIRTHDVAALKDGLRVMAAIAAATNSVDAWSPTAHEGIRAACRPNCGENFPGQPQPTGRG